MPGLLNNPTPMPPAAGGQVAPAQAPQPGAAAPDPQATSPQNQNAPRGAPGNRPQPRQATPQEVQQYKTFVDNAYKVIYNNAPDPKTPDAPPLMKQLLARLGQGSDFVGNLGQVSGMVCLRVFEGMKQAKQQIDAPMIAQAGLEVTADLADLAKRAKIHEYTPDEVKQAYQRAATVFIHTLAQSGQLTAQQLQQLQQVGQQSQQPSGGMHGHLLNQVQGMMPQGQQEPGEGTPAEEAQPDEQNDQDKPQPQPQPQQPQAQPPVPPRRPMPPGLLKGAR